MRKGTHLPAFHSWTDYLLAWLDRRPADMFASMSAFSTLKIMDDPEAAFQVGWLLCEVGEHEPGLHHLRRAVTKGYYAAPALTGSPHFDALRSDPGFQEVLSEAETGRQQALAAFRDAGGERLLGQ